MNYQGRYLGLVVIRFKGTAPPHVWQITFRIGRRRLLAPEYR